MVYFLIYRAYTCVNTHLFPSRSIKHIYLLDFHDEIFIYGKQMDITELLLDSRRTDPVNFLGINSSVFRYVAKRQTHEQIIKQEWKYNIGHWRI